MGKEREKWGSDRNAARYKEKREQRKIREDSCRFKPPAQLPNQEKRVKLGRSRKKQTMGRVGSMSCMFVGDGGRFNSYHIHNRNGERVGAGRTPNGGACASRSVSYSSCSSNFQSPDSNPPTREESPPSSARQQDQS